MPEATDKDEELYGTDRMLEALNKEPDAAPEKLLENVHIAVNEFVGDAPQFVDLTMLALTSPELEKKLDSTLDGIEKLTFDLKGLKYISSAGLRVLAAAMDIMEDRGEMFVANANNDVRDVFEITGFIEDLNMI